MNKLKEIMKKYLSDYLILMIVKLINFGFMPCFAAKEEGS